MVRQCVVCVPKEGWGGRVTDGVMEGRREGPSVWTQQEVEELGAFQ